MVFQLLFSDSNGTRVMFQSIPSATIPQANFQKSAKSHPTPRHFFLSNPRDQILGDTLC